MAACDPTVPRWNHDDFRWLGRRLGVGSTSKVYAAMERASGDLVAVKVCLAYALC